MDCESWQARLYGRLELARVDVTDGDKYARTDGGTADRALFPSKPTLILRGRNLDCADFSYADLRRVDLAGARLVGAYLFGADLEGASLDDVVAQGAWFVFNKLQGATLRRGQFQGAVFGGALLERADLDRAELQSVNFYNAQLTGANLAGAKLQLAGLRRANLDGAILWSAELHLADLREASLRGAFLKRAQLHGADLTDAVLTAADLAQAEVWRSKISACGDADVRSYHEATAISVRVGMADDDVDTFELTPAGFSSFAQAVALNDIDRDSRRKLSTELSSTLTALGESDAAQSDQQWAQCRTDAESKPDSAHANGMAAALHDVVCDAPDPGS